MTSISPCQAIVLDTPDPQRLAEFYSALTGTPIARRDDDWWQLETPAGGGAVLAFQLAPDHEPPTWPSGPRPQQIHLDFDAPDLDVAEREALEIGARKHEHQPGETFRVFLDPSGHPFCLCLGS
jgi:predicted enzyme related to lactoylglutathione lyase